MLDFKRGGIREVPLCFDSARAVNSNVTFYIPATMFEYTAPPIEDLILAMSENSHPDKSVHKFYPSNFRKRVLEDSLIKFIE